MPQQQRTVFVISDGTGITAEMLGHSLLTQFENIGFQQVTIPFVDSLAKAEECVSRIREASKSDSNRPLVFSTLINAEVRNCLRSSNAYVIDFFEMFLDPLEAELGMRSTHTVGRSHSAFDRKGYSNRIEAVNFTMAHDDGVSSREFDKADVILVGVSRSGKTPTSLYLALQFGVKAANYPLIPEDFDGRIEVTRTYRLTRDGEKGADPYRIRHETTFRNLGTGTQPLGKASLSLGTAGLIDAEPPSTDGF